MKCYYHNDLDGRCAGAIVAYFTKNYNTDDYFEVDYRQTFDFSSIKDGEDVYFVDYSFSTEENLNSLKELVKHCNVIWIDHHTTSIEHCKNNEWADSVNGVRLEGISGAALTWVYFTAIKYSIDANDYATFIPNSKEDREHFYDDWYIPDFVKLVSDYDCWHYDFSNDTIYFKIGMDAIDNSALSSEWKYLIDGKDCPERSIIQKGYNIKSYIDKDNQFYFDNFAYEADLTIEIEPARKERVSGDDEFGYAYIDAEETYHYKYTEPIQETYKCIVVNRKQNSWIFSDKLKDYDVGVVWVFDGKKYNYSFFSVRDDIDCSKIAKHFGGGGRRGASGCTTDYRIV